MNFTRVGKNDFLFCPRKIKIPFFFSFPLSFFLFLLPLITKIVISPQPPRRTKSNDNSSFDVNYR